MNALSLFLLLPQRRERCSSEFADVLCLPLHSMQCLFGPFVGHHSRRPIPWHLFLVPACSCLQMRSLSQLEGDNDNLGTLKFVDDVQ